MDTSCLRPYLSATLVALCLSVCLYSEDLWPPRPEKDGNRADIDLPFLFPRAVEEPEHDHPNTEAEDHALAIPSHTNVSHMSHFAFSMRRTVAESSHRIAASSGDETRHTS